MAWSVLLIPTLPVVVKLLLFVVLLLPAPKQLCRLSDSRRSEKAVYKNLCFFMPFSLKICRMYIVTLLPHLRSRRLQETLSRVDYVLELRFLHCVVLVEAGSGSVLPYLRSWRVP